MYYTNGSTITKTFHGVTFGPGETKEVFGIINDPKFVLTSVRKEPPKRDEVDSSKSEEIVEVPVKKRRGRKPSSKVSQESAEVASADDVTENPVSSDVDTTEVDNIKEV